MPGYTTRNLELDVAGQPYRLRVLADLQQFSDPDGDAERLGISSAQWSLFGQVWDSGRILAEAMGTYDVAGKRVLELGCGIGLASLVLQRRGAEVVATDIHPLAASFLAYNAALNALPAVHYRHMEWSSPLPMLGQFDLIIASDVLYEASQVETVAAVVERHARQACEVVLVDPGRGHSARLATALAANGFVAEAPTPAFAANNGRVRTLRFVRPASTP